MSPWIGSAWLNVAQASALPKEISRAVVNDGLVSRQLALTPARGDGKQASKQALHLPAGSFCVDRALLVREKFMRLAGGYALARPTAGTPMFREAKRTFGEY